MVVSQASRPSAGFSSQPEQRVWIAHLARPGARRGLVLRSGPLGLLKGGEVLPPIEEGGLAPHGAHQLAQGGRALVRSQHAR